MLTKLRVRLAFGTAIIVDLLQLALGPVGFAFADEILDVIAMAIIWRLIGFHVLLLPTFALELFPVADVIPSWTICVAAVIAIKRRQEPKPPGPGQVIDA
jgi:hypothetical protein